MRKTEARRHQDKMSARILAPPIKQSLSLYRGHRFRPWLSLHFLTQSSGRRLPTIPLTTSSRRLFRRLPALGRCLTRDSAWRLTIRLGRANSVLLLRPGAAWLAMPLIYIRLSGKGCIYSPSPSLLSIRRPRGIACLARSHHSSAPFWPQFQRCRPSWRKRREKRLRLRGTWSG